MSAVEQTRRAVALQRPSDMPVFALSEEFDVRMAGELYEDYCQDALVMSRVQIQAVRSFGYDWAWLQVDDCIEFEALGVGSVGSGNVLRATTDNLPATRATLDSLRIPDFRREGRGPAYLEAISRVRETFGDDKVVVGRTAAPFSAVGLLYGISQSMTLPYDDPQFLKDTMDFLADMQIEFGRQQKNAGAHAIWFGDCNAGSHLMSLGHYLEFAFPYADRVAAAYQDMGLMIFYHASEDDPRFLREMSRLHISAVSIGEHGDVAAAKADPLIGGRMCLLGNVDPIKVLLLGSTDEVRASTRALLQQVSPQGGHLINSGEMIPRDTPEENMRAYVETVKQYGHFA
ncbi:MAG: uroporphyrinogen decarboxylase family protein [Anaerolineae bacterium]